MIAKGPFEVKLVPQPAAEGELVGRMTIDKTWQGDLEGTSKGQMLAFMSSVKGSAGYVAMEQVHGTLAGRKGSFVLQHNGIMNRSQPSLTVAVVPDSGTDELTGLTGSMSIETAPGGKHFYQLDFALPE